MLCAHNVDIWQRVAVWAFFFSPILKNPPLFVFKDGLFNVTEELSDSDCLFQRYNNRHSHLEHLR